MPVHPIDACARPRRALAIACWLFLAAELAAEPSRIRFEHLTNEDGLSQNTVFTIEQDRQGFMWFGTKVGLNRYDGYGFKVYTQDPLDRATLANGFVRVIAEDAAGMLWIGTYGGGIDRFDPPPRPSPITRTTRTTPRA